MAWARTFAAALASAAIITFATACDGYWEVQGRVVTVSCDGAGTSSIVETAEEPLTGAPLPGAQITLFLVLKQDDLPDRDSIWTEVGNADTGGKFQVGLVGSPHKTKAGLEVSAPGYQPAYIVYRTKEVQPQMFLAIMRPEACPS